MDTATKYDARFVELANQNAIMPTHTNGAGANGAVQPQTSETRQEPSETEGQPLQRRVRSSDLIDFLTDAGYSFRLNLCDDSIEVNGECITDVIRSQIRCKLRDAGLGKFLAAAEDALVTHAAKNAYHPVRAYLESLSWDGGNHIARLANHFTDTNQIFGLYLRKWLIGSVARAYTGAHNAVLVMDGPQGIGKSQFARWLCPLPGLFLDSSIDPDNKDHSLLAMRSWIWEVGEMGATTKRADVEALKAFLSRERFTIRPAYGRYDVKKNGLASFIGTVNNSNGIFSDPTGSRRYWTTTVTTIDWSYARSADVNQVWAEALAAYRNGESWTLTPDDASRAAEINEEYEVPDIFEDLLRKHFQLDPADREHWTSTADILTTLQANGLSGTAKSNAMQLSATLKRLNFDRHQNWKKERGYWGVWS